MVMVRIMTILSRHEVLMVVLKVILGILIVRVVMMMVKIVMKGLNGGDVFT